MENVNIEVKWTGAYPCLCHGEWILKINGKDYSDLIPFRKFPAETFGYYESCSLNDEWEEDWDKYSDGLYEEVWIPVNEKWLSKLPIPKRLYSDIFRAFQKEDWRHGSCGGCI